MNHLNNPSSANYRIVPTLISFLVLLLRSWIVDVNTTAGDWPQLLGPSRNGQSAETNLATSWSQNGPPVLWKRKIGQGFASPSVVSNRLVLPHRIGQEEIIECWDVASGETLWKISQPTSYKDDFGSDDGPRATPTISGGRVFLMSAEGLVTARELSSGSLVWSVDTKTAFGASKGYFGMACSPLITQGRLLLNIGGRDGAGIVALDEATGKLLWQSTNDEASYSSPVLAQIGQDSIAAFFTRSGLVLLQPGDGKVLATHPWRSRTAASVNAALPIVVGNHIFLSTSYDTGAILLNWSEGRLQKIWSKDEVLSNHYATSVYHQGYLYGFDGRQEQRPTLTCVELATGKSMWREESIPSGTILVSGGQLLVTLETGELWLVQATAGKFNRLARSQLFGNGLRAYPALARGKFFARSKSELVAIDLTAKGQ